ncbi:hypothetical protein [Arcobacter sp.]|uniref:hypothetical protein n=1 Tax=Arcobacter sp. TaxID=1872629 RepID=UPI003C722598
MRRLIFLISVLISFKVYLFASCEKNIYKEYLSIDMLQQASDEQSFRAHDCKNLDSSVFIKEKDKALLVSEEFFKYFKNDGRKIFDNWWKKLPEKPIGKHKKIVAMNDNYYFLDNNSNEEIAYA